MSEPKPFASLSSGLLARKGAAKPAMRPQGYGGFGASLEDLGWNDMGHPHPVEHVPSSISALTPAPGGRHGEHHESRQEPEGWDEQGERQPAFEPQAFEPFEPEPEAEVEPHYEEPIVLEQQRALEASFEPAPVVPLPRRKAPKAAPRPAAVPAELPARAKAAFTLRLDPERHLRLRLACAVTRRSAQQIVTGALDEYLGSLPELDALAEHVPVKAGKR